MFENTIAIFGRLGLGSYRLRGWRLYQILAATDFCIVHAGVLALLSLSLTLTACAEWW